MSGKMDIPITEPGFKSGSGVATSISYEQLIEILRDRGYLRKTEDVRGLMIEERGITFYVEKR